MKKRLTNGAWLLLAATLAMGCGEKKAPKSVCDEMFDDCGGASSSKESGPVVELKEDSNPNYTFDETDTNAEGSVSYEIFVRSFFDADGDGVGDFAGVEQKLPYLHDLGVKTIWLMPIMPSPSYHGYDVSDYYSVNPNYGTMEDFESLLAKAKEENIDVMIDIVFNHSSKQNPWFAQSYQDYVNNNEAEDSKKDWYVWSATQTGTCTHRYGNLYYEGRFDEGMPDFNTKCEAVKKEMVKILDFWANKGVKGFRFDAVKYFEYEDTSYNTAFLSYLHDAVVKDYPGVYFVGENWEDGNAKYNAYFSSSFESFFTFPSSNDASGNGSILRASKALVKGSAFSKEIEANEAERKKRNPNSYSSYFLSNHDMDRSSGSLSGNYAKMAANIAYLLPGTPYCYYGEEILLKGKRITSPDDASDARRRLPMVWSKDDKTGECSFPEKNRMDLANNDQVSLGALDQLSAAYSITNHYKKVFHVRNHYPFLKNAVYQDLSSKITASSDYVIAYSLTLGEEEILVIHNCEALKNAQIEMPSLPGYHIADSISSTRLVPELEGTTLKLGRLSTVILQK